MNTQILKWFGALTISLGLFACGDSTQNAQHSTTTNNNTEKTVIKFGTTVGDFGDMVKDSIKPILEKKGYKVELIEFTDYVRPNLALSSGDIDVNVFQHLPYLKDFAKEHKLDLTEVFQVPTAPLGIYPGKLKKLDEVKNNSTIAVPNDPSNLARALIMLKELGWISLKDNLDPTTASVKDISNNPKNLKLVELEAAQLPRSREDVDFSVINGNYAMSSNIPLTDALYTEPSYEYVNWGVIRTNDKDSKWAQDIIQAYNSDEFKQYALEKFKGYKYPQTWNIQENTVQ